jgi:hypothetical protein
MSNESKPYTIFNKTKNVPVRVWYNGKIDPTITEWDTDLWIERGEDWYALMSSGLRDKRVRIIERDIWLRSALI